ncbi:Neurotrypsin [Holothuria leucospilota]|uniref:Neurotrypsin n=1 Tax=Holothuria leucospilota TaxID=206669 RepID=A0A9Q1B9T5_HOLLE|nr:Neurotrypsin [Holothuria leucospilota]
MLYKAGSKVRLVDGNGSYGRVEIILENSWNTLVTQYWTKLEGGVVCRQLGFRGVHSVTHDTPPDILNLATELIFKCEGYELTLQECAQHNTEDYQDSFYSYGQYLPNFIAQVMCITNSTFPSELIFYFRLLCHPFIADNVRLVNGDSHYGTVEVLVKGVWRRICGEEWTKLEGGVVCRELGFRGVHSIPLNPKHDNESTINHYVRFRCIGFEESITDCVQPNLASNLPNHISVCKDAEVTCLRDMPIRG